MEHLLSFDALSAALNYIRTNARNICLCYAAPLTRDQAISDYMLAKGIIGSGNFRGPEEYTEAPDAEPDAGPEAILYVLQSTKLGVVVDGVSRYVALVGVDELLVVAPAENITLVVCENPVIVGEWCIRIRQPLQSCLEEE